MQHRFLLILLLICSTFLQAQVQKGSFAITDNFRILYKKNPQESPFINSPQLNFSLPTMDYYLSKNWSIGGSASLVSYATIWQGAAVRKKQIQINPHLKFGVNWRRHNLFLSASAVYLKQTGFDNSVEVKELATYLGAGFQLFLSKNIAWENWMQFPFILENEPRLNVDCLYSSGLKFYLNFNNDPLQRRDLFDYYLDKHNIRIGLNMNGFKYFDEKTSLFDRVDLSYQNFFRDYFIFYFDYKFLKHEFSPLEEISTLGKIRLSKIKLGFQTYFPLSENWYLTGKTGLISTNTDFAFAYRLRQSFGFDLGLGAEYFFPKKAVIRFGVDWQNTYANGFSSSYSNALPYVGWEIFVNQKISIEPRLTYHFYQSEEEFFRNQMLELEKSKNQNLVFELKLRTMFFREKGLLNRKSERN